MNVHQKPTLPCILSHAATQYPNSPAIITEKMTLSYHDLNLLVEETASRLQARGILHGDRVGIFLPNSYEYAVLLMAMLRAGIVAVPVSNRWPQKQIAEALDGIRCQKLIVDDEIEIHPQLTSKTVFRTSEIVTVCSYTELPNSPPEGGQGGVMDFEQKTHPSVYYLNPDQHATIIFTSGSSGLPKAALHAYKSHYFSALGSNQNIPFGPGDRWLLSLPLYHAGGLGILFRAALGGGTVAIPRPEFELADTIIKYRVSHISLVATQLYRLLNREKNTSELSSLKAVLLGGSTIPASLLKQANTHNLPLFTTYGSTEMASQVTTTRRDDPENKLHTSGRPLTHREVMISPEGEILVRGETLFKGYLAKKGLRKPFNRDGWFASGDLGEFDADGCLAVKGRKDNMFISGGENIQPEEIEQALCKIDGVLQAVVVPVADAEFGHRPVAFVKMETDKQLDVDFLSQQLAQRIARFKIPDRFLAWPQGLQENNMKMDRKYFLAAT